MYNFVRKSKIYDIRYNLDTAGRIKNKEVTTGINTFTTNYGYDKFLVTSEELSNGSQITYTYDNNLITSKKLTNANNVTVSNDTYLYDDFGRLKQEKDKNNNTISYTYDDNGNIKSKVYSTGEEYFFSYDSNNLDKLVGYYKFNNVKEINYTIQYDSKYTFNPVKITRSDNNVEINLEWLGRKLIKYGDVNFKYNCHGVRIEKDSPDNKTEYFVEGNRIKGMRIHDKVNSGYIGYNFTYNSNNEVETICVNNEYYYYERDITKNINKILDSNGNVVVSYRYDAWGNVLEEVVTNSDLRFNPFLYKGYVYDRETQLYWVSSRYYSPELCRWISPDSVEYLDPQSINGLNLYCYCENDPVNNIDPSGYKWYHWLLGGAVVIGTVTLAIATGGASLAVAAATGAIIGFSTGVIAGGITFDDGEIGWDWEEASKGFFSGSVTGTISGFTGQALSALAPATQIIGNMTLAGTIYTMQGIISKEPISLEGFVTTTIFGGLGGILGLTNTFSGTFLRSTATSVGLGIAEMGVGELMEYFQSKKGMFFNRYLF